MALSPNTVQAIHRLHSDGYSTRAIAIELRVSRTTVTRYIADSQRAIRSRSISKPSRAKLAKADQEKLVKLYKDSKGNSCVMQLCLQSKPQQYGLPIGFSISDRAIRRYFQEHYPELACSKRLSGPIRYETERGERLQVDFVTANFHFDGDSEPRRIYLFEAVYPWSRKAFVEVCADMTQPSWLRAISRCFCRYGIPQSILCDNDTSLVHHRDRAGRPHYHPLFEWLCKPLGVRPIACRVGRPQTKGAVERFGRFLQENGLVYCKVCGNEIRTEADLQKQLDEWLEVVADQRPGDERGLGRKTVKELYAIERKHLVFPPGLQATLDVGAWTLPVNARAELHVYGLRIVLPRAYALSSVVLSLRPNGDFAVTSTTTGRLVFTGTVPKDNLHKYRFNEEAQEEAPASDRSSNFALFAKLLGEK